MSRIVLSEVPPSAGETVEEISVPVMESAFVRVKVRSGGRQDAKKGHRVEAHPIYKENKVIIFVPLRLPHL